MPAIALGRFSLVRLLKEISYCAYYRVDFFIPRYPMQNVSKALTTLHDLKELQFSATDLEKVPDLVYTVRKVSSKVKIVSV